MKLSTIAKFVAWLAVAATVCFVLWRNSYVRVYDSYVSGVEIRSCVTWSRYHAMPDWQPESGLNPPITPQTAIDVARVGVSQLNVGENQDWIFASLDLEPLNNKWIYRVQFRKQPAASAVARPGHNLSYYVTLDGKPIQPWVVRWRWLQSLLP